jgi:hypothetical protein
MAISRGVRTGEAPFFDWTNWYCFLVSMGSGPSISDWAARLHRIQLFYYLMNPYNWNGPKLAFICLLGQNMGLWA